MRRPWQTWSLFGMCLAAVVVAMAWISFMALKLDRTETEALRQSALEEDVRLALWRMETILAGIIAQESNLPYFEYTSFYPVERAYTRMFNKVERGEILVPSRLLTLSVPHALLYFQIEPGGEITSPQVPQGELKELAEIGYTSTEKLEAASGALETLKESPGLAVLKEALPESVILEQAKSEEMIPILSKRSTKSAQAVLSQREFTKRNWSQVSNSQQSRSTVEESSSDVNVGTLQAVWLGDMLLLARRVAVNGGEYIQGCRVNWSVLKEQLLDEVEDLLPEADLHPAPAGGGDDGARRLAALPVTLIPGNVLLNSPSGLTPISIALIIAWGCVLLAGASAGMLLWGALVLSERRGAFVSAVTHELRTPLTTLRMYTEMLAGDMVRSEKKRTAYLDTIQAEAERLGHLVENVLAYSRLERHPGKARQEALTVEALLDRVVDRLARHAEGASMRLDVNLSSEDAGTMMRADASAVEQILFNLVDNACKYAGSSENDTIHLEVVGGAGRSMVWKVRDHGVGVSGQDTKRLFKPFSKSVHSAAASAPGVGLGLALSRRLAREMGGDLRFDDTNSGGACFTLTLPVMS